MTGALEARSLRGTYGDETLETRRKSIARGCSGGWDGVGGFGGTRVEGGWHERDGREGPWVGGSVARPLCGDSSAGIEGREKAYYWSSLHPRREQNTGEQ
uniref:Uncharacterized protein n=1 Tax=Vespula pensylvanica TaxID=30213 RepID=A0A834JM70_VESPE|nr:hypothetical protein H0235_017697 [Vespula pensylvanica]